MKRFFNTAGPIDSTIHYALDPLHRWDLQGVLSLIDQRKYFLLHAPRQTGKTTCLKALAERLNQQGRYRCICISAESAQAARHDVAQAIESLLGTLALEAEDQLADPWVEQNWQQMLQRYKSLNALVAVLRGWCLHNPKPLVLLIDEIDALVGLSLISVLRQLRAGYPKRPKQFPHSLVLCGMRHLRDYRMELGDEGKTLFSNASPFNINSTSLRLGDFSQDDVKTLYAQHTQETGQRFEDGVIERVYELTQGQPWLVNALAYDVCFEDKAGRDRSKLITVNDIDTAKERLIQRRETHLEQLMDKLKQERVHRVIASIVSGQDLEMSLQDVEYCTDLGLVCHREDGAVVIANPIYREVIPRFIMGNWQQRLANTTPRLARLGQPLDMNELLSAFQRFFREHSESWLDAFQYKEAGPQLLLQAFLQRTVNSRGAIAREQAVGSGRTDLIVTWPLGDKDVTLQRAEKKQIVVLELKLIHRNDGADTVIGKGLKQTAAYMDRFHAPEGHLLIFDRREGKSWDERIWTKQETGPDGKKIAVWGL